MNMYVCNPAARHMLQQYLSESVKDETEVSDGGDCGKALLIHVTSLLDEAPPNVVICETGPQPPNLHRRRAIVRWLSLRPTNSGNRNCSLCRHYAVQHPE